MIRSWTFQNKVTAGFAVMVVLAALTAAIAVFAMRTVVASKDRLVNVNAENLTNAAKLLAASNEYTAAFRGYLLLVEDQFLRQRVKAGDEFEETLRRLDQGVYTSEGRRLLTDIRKAQMDFASAQEQIIVMRKTKNGLEGVTHAVEKRLCRDSNASPVLLRRSSTVSRTCSRKLSAIRRHAPRWPTPCR